MLGTLPSTGGPPSCIIDRIWLICCLALASCFSKSCTCLIEDMRRFVSLVNWHLTPRLEHSEQLDVSVASHLTFRSLHASQLGSLRRCLYARFWAARAEAAEAWVGEMPGVVMAGSFCA